MAKKQKQYMTIYNEGREFERRRIKRILKEHFNNLLDLEIITRYDAYGCSRRFNTAHLKIRDLKLFLNTLNNIIFNKLILKQKNKPDEK